MPVSAGSFKSLTPSAFPSQTPLRRTQNSWSVFFEGREEVGHEIVGAHLHIHRWKGWKNQSSAPSGCFRMDDAGAGWLPHGSR